MTKLQKRYYLPEQIKKILPQLIGEKITVVLQDGPVHYLNLKKMVNDKLFAIDMRNIRHDFEQAQIAEIIVDKEL
jgi:predicted metallo-beta-lactamase superfamily hydrolase